MRREAGMARSGKLERFHTEVNETNYAESVAINAEVTEDHNLRWNGWREAQEDAERNKYTPEGSLASVIGYELAKDVFEGRKDLNSSEIQQKALRHFIFEERYSAPMILSAMQKLGITPSPECISN